MVVVWILVLLLVDELGVDFQIADQGMALGKSKVSVTPSLSITHKFPPYVEA